MRSKIKTIFASISIGIFLSIGLLIPCESAFKDTGWGVRPVGMGGAFCAIANDANAPMWNPAGVAQLNKAEADLMYSKLYAGLDNVDLGLYYCAFAYPIEKVCSVGFVWGEFNSPDQYKEDSFVLSLAKKINDYIPNLIPEASFGINLKYLSHSYTLDPRTKNDTVFAKGRSNGTFTFDLGMLIRTDSLKEEGFRIGLAVENITEPDVGLETKDKVPMQIRSGIAYNTGRCLLLNSLIIDDIVPAFAITKRDNDLNIHAGIESWLMRKTLGIRIGANLKEITTGLSYDCKLLEGFAININYTFIWPLYIQNTYGSHRISLGVSF